MNIKIYDYHNKKTDVLVPDDKAILGIYVHIVSGDETGFILFDDCSRLCFDASNCRIMGYDDGDYFVEGDNIKRWIDFNSWGDCFKKSYHRQRVFSLLYGAE